MEYKSLPFPIPGDIAADLCDPGRPPPGHVRVAVFRFSEESAMGDYVTRTNSDTIKDLDFTLSLQDDDTHDRPTSYRTGFCMPEILECLQEWEP